MNLKQPARPNNIPQESQWLSGIGAGSWFSIEVEKETYRIKRYSPAGQLECNRRFNVTSTGFDIKQPYEFVYISHCMMCTIFQNKKTYIFKYYDD